MERKGSKLRRMQEQMFKDCRDAQSYYEQFRHCWNDQDFTHQQLAVYNELSFLISYMGWTAEYMEYCEKHPSECVRV